MNFTMPSADTLRELLARLTPPPLAISLFLCFYFLHKLLDRYPGLIHDLSIYRGMADKARVAPASKRLASRVS